MSNIVRIRRRAAGGAAGAPSSLENAELAFNEQDRVLYIGEGTGGSGGSATTIIPIGGPGAFVDKTSAQTIDGIKTYSVSPVVPTAVANDNSTKAASTAYVDAAITGSSVSDGDKGDITVSSSGSVWSVDADAITNAKLANMPTFTIKGNDTGGTADPKDLTVSEVKTMLAYTKGDVGLGNVDNTSDANKPVSTATQTALNLKIDSSLIGAANGVVPLDGSSKISSIYLPGYVDDVLEVANYAALPGTGTVSIMYVTLDTNNVYRWTGSTYAEIAASPGSTDAVSEGSVNLYFTDARARTAVIASAITNSDTTHSPSGDAVFGAMALKADSSSLGTMSIQNANAVVITGGTIDGIILDGGTF